MKDGKRLEGCSGIVNELRIEFLENEIGIKLPRSFINFIKNCDGGVPIASDFEYIDVFKSRKRMECVGSFLSLNSEKFNGFYNFWKTPPEFFPKGLVIFAGTGGGDFICFDYRQGRDNPNPPIAYWNHEADIGKDVSFVANNFEEFLKMLTEPEDV